MSDIKKFRVHDWEGIAQVLKEKPGEPVLLEEFTQTPRCINIVSSVNSDPPNALREIGGSVRANLRNEVRPRQRPRVADVFLTWTP